MPKLIEILEFFDNTGNVMVKRLPEDDSAEIKWGAQLTVRESQRAIFFRDGKSLDVFSAGRYVLQTQNIPLITKWITSLGYGTTSPFRSEVYFLNMKLFPNLKWGTSEPILFEDTKLDMVRLRAHGIVSIQIQNPTLFLNKVVGTQGLYVDEQISNYIKNIIASRLTVVLAKTHRTVFDLPKNFDILSVLLRNSLTPDFDGLGLALHDIFINSISLPPEVQKNIDKRTGIAAMGNLDDFLKFQVGQSIEKAAENTSGSAGDTVGLGAGFAMGMMIPQMLSQSRTNETLKKAVQEQILELIKSLKNLLDNGAITQEEFNEAKQRLLSNLK
jgi:membrane protease subunit (stomatin/prohibitin family)